jgi:hypothetical protein
MLLEYCFLQFIQSSAILITIRRASAYLCYYYVFSCSIESSRFVFTYHRVRISILRTCVLIRTIVCVISYPVGGTPVRDCWTLSDDLQKGGCHSSHPSKLGVAPLLTPPGAGVYREEEKVLNIQYRDVTKLTESHQQEQSRRSSAPTKHDPKVQENKNKIKIEYIQMCCM